MLSNINTGNSDKPNAGDAVERPSGSAFPVCIPRIPKDRFPITSQEDLVEKLTAAMSPRSAPFTQGEALPASRPRPTAADAK
jgi:hypothetical protein